jgi:hypothetical protein
MQKLRTIQEGDMTLEPLVMVAWAALLPAAVVIWFFFIVGSFSHHFSKSAFCS